MGEGRESEFIMRMPHMLGQDSAGRADGRVAPNAVTRT